MSRPALACFVAAVFAASAAHSAPAAPDVYAPGRAIVTDLNKIVARKGVQETFEVTLGGARQVVNVRGADRSNPILLFVHGGPASVEMPLAWAFQRPWEDDFTVVQWDQRGAGRSFRLEDPKATAPTLSPDRYRDDAIELIEQLRRRYGQRKVFLLGHSWGSIVGLSVAAKRPDLLYAYIGVGQVVDFRRNEEAGFAWTLQRARDLNNVDAVRELEALQPYPGPGAFNLDKLGTERKWNVEFGGLAWGRSSGDFYFHLGRLSPEYTAEDRKAWDDGSAFTMQAMFPSLSDISFASLHRVDTPVIMMLGRHDYTTPPEIATDWMRRLKAPRKTVVMFEDSAHLPMIEEPGRFFSALLSEALPLSKAEHDPGSRPRP